MTPRRTYSTGSVGSLDDRPEARRKGPKHPLGFAPQKPTQDERDEKLLAEWPEYARSMQDEEDGPDLTNDDLYDTLREDA